MKGKDKNMNVLEKTRELGEALYNSPEYQAVKEAQAVMEADETASHLSLIHISWPPLSAI